MTPQEAHDRMMARWEEEDRRWRREMAAALAVPLALLAALLGLCLWLDAPRTLLLMALFLLFGIGLFSLRRWVQEYEEGGQPAVTPTHPAPTAAGD